MSNASDTQSAGNTIYIIPKKGQTKNKKTKKKKKKKKKKKSNQLFC